MLKVTLSSYTARLAALMLCIFVFASAVAHADPDDSTTFILSHVTSDPGQQISIPLSISSVHAIGGFNILFEIEQGALAADYITLDGTRSEGLQTFTVAINNYGTDAITGIVAYLPPDYVPPGDGAVANLFFTTDASIPKGTLLPLSFYDEEMSGLYNAMSDEIGNVLRPDFNHGSILFEVDSAGLFDYSDVNLNGIQYELADLYLMRQQLEEGIESYINEDAQTRNADVNRDGLPWTVADLILVRDVIFDDLPPQVGDFKRNIVHMPGDSIWFDGFTGTPTSQFDIPIFFSNTLAAGAVSFKINYGQEDLGFVSYSLDGSRIPSTWERVSAVERASGIMFYAMPEDTFGSGQDYPLDPGDGLLVTLRFEVRNPPENRIKFHFERLQNLGQANGYATINYPWWDLASFQQIDSDIYMTFVRGDADGSGFIDIDDVIFLIAYIFQSGPAPSVFEEGDFNADLQIDIDDVTALLAYIFG